jgi:hypothetical protein
MWAKYAHIKIYLYHLFLCCPHPTQQQEIMCASSTNLRLSSAIGQAHMPIWLLIYLQILIVGYAKMSSQKRQSDLVLEVTITANNITNGLKKLRKKPTKL